MCRTIHALLSTLICGVQMIVRVFMTTILMMENVIRMVLQTTYNFLSFMLQLVSLVPLCCVFLVSSRMKCFMCGGGGPCPVSRGGACDCLMSFAAIVILFFIFRATGVLDKIFYSIGYTKATTHIVRFVPSTGSITECSRNDTDTEYVFYPLDTTVSPIQYFYVDYTETETTTTPPNPRLRMRIDENAYDEIGNDAIEDTTMKILRKNNLTDIDRSKILRKNNLTDIDRSKILKKNNLTDIDRSKIFHWTTVLYYLA